MARFRRLNSLRGSDRISGAIPVAALILLPLLVKLPLLIGYLVSNPMRIWGALSTGTSRPLLFGAPSLDPNIAYTSHALGTLAARQMFAGETIWWNPYEGLGAPLAGEMQAAALFPPTWLLLLPQGQVLEHILFQVVAGLASYALLRTLGIGRVGAWLGATAFSFNGVFAWLGNAIVNPVCFLPVVLLGIKLLARTTRRDQLLGGALVTFGLSGSLYAGFPEVAYLNGLLIAVWTLHKAYRAGRGAALIFLLRVGIFGLCALLLTAPLLIAFADYLLVADIGEHAGNFLAEGAVPRQFLTELFLPYFIGGPTNNHYAFWGSTGGYAGLCLTVLAVAGAVGLRLRSLRIVLVIWILFCLGVTFGVPMFIPLAHLIPLTHSAALYRYLDSSWLFAMSVLAAFAIDDLASEPGKTWRLKVGLVATAVLISVAVAFSLGEDVRPDGKISALSIAGQLAAVSGVAAAAWLSARSRTGVANGVIAAVAALEIVTLFAIPIASYPRRVTTELGGVRFLQRELGMQRFVTYGPIEANYGSFFGIAEINHNDLPTPRDWVKYSEERLGNAGTSIFFRLPSRSKFLKLLPAYAESGARFVVTPTDMALPLVQRYRDRAMRIYEVPGTSAYFGAPSCNLVPESRTLVRATCARPSKLERLELWMPGWKATVSGRATPLMKTKGVFQAVSLPRGPSTVSFRFEPPFLSLGYIAAVLGAILFAAMLACAWRSKGVSGRQAVIHPLSD